MTTHYQIQVGNEIIEFEGPDNLSEAQITHLADTKLRTAKPGQKFQHSVFAGTYGNARRQSATAAGEASSETQYDPEQSSALGAFLRGVPKDATFNFDDEIAAKVNANVPFLAELDNILGLGGIGGQGSDEAANLASLRAQAEVDEQLHPGMRTAGSIAGVLGTLPRAGAAVVARLPQAARAAMKAHPILTAMAVSGAGGTLSGAGAGEEGTRAQSAALGGVTSAALGTAIAGGIELAPVIAHYARAIFNKATHSDAVQQIVRALKRDGFDVSSPSGVQKIKAALQEFTGKPVSLADIGGATRSRAGVALRAPSEAQQSAIDVVQARQAGQGQRIARDIRANVSPRTDVHALDEQLVAQRAQEAERLRDAALFDNVAASSPSPQTAVVPAPEGLQAGVLRTIGEEVPETFQRVPVPVNAAVPAATRESRVVDDPMLQQLARLPMAQKALTEALALSENERGLLATQGLPIDHLPDLSRGSQLDVRTFDAMKRFLDQQVNALYKGDTPTFKAAELQQVKALRDTIRDRLRTVVPEYGKYLDAYKGSSEMIDALGEGRNFSKLDPEEIAAGQANRSEAGQELYRTGAARNLLDVIRETKDTTNPASRILNSEESRAQLAATGVDPAKAAALNRSVQQERVLNLLPQELAGSQTAQRQAAMIDADSGLDHIVPIIPGNPFAWLGMGARKVFNRMSTERNAVVNREILPRLLETNPQAIDGIITELEQQGNVAAAMQLRQAQRARRFGGLGGVMIGSPVALQSDEEAQ